MTNLMFAAVMLFALGVFFEQMLPTLRTREKLRDYVAKLSVLAALEKAKVERL